MAAFAALTTALALALPAASASAATTVPAVPIVSIDVPGSLPCHVLYWQLRAALLSGNTPWANFLSNVFIYSQCGGAAI